MLHWLTLWEHDFPIWVCCALALGLYRWLPGRRLDLRAFFWCAGVLAVFVALQSALDFVGDNYLFSVHMVQHLILAMVAPPLLIAGLPGDAVDRLLRSPLAALVRGLVRPLVAASAYFVVLVGWHIPVLYDYALTHSPVLMAEKLSFLAVGILFWWAVVLHREAEAWNLQPLGEVAYLTCGALPSVVVGLTVALLPRAVYVFYLHKSIQLGLSALGDQHLGGLIMFGFDNVLMVVVAGYYFWRMFPEDGADEASEVVAKPRG